MRVKRVNICNLLLRILLLEITAGSMKRRIMVSDTKLTDKNSCLFITQIRQLIECSPVIIHPTVFICDNDIQDDVYGIFEPTDHTSNFDGIYTRIFC
jgi:hypothetical protein